jgi:ArsR family transcriptional regulator
MDVNVAEHVAEVLKAVAHPVRLQIIELLEHQERCVGQLTDALGVQQAVVSQQLRIMRDRGVLSARREGARVFYHIENPNLINLLHCMYNHCNIPSQHAE